MIKLGLFKVPFLGIKPKILLFGDTGWAMGRIFTNIAHYLKDDYDFTILDWEKDYTLFFNTWKNYDIIIGSTTLSSVLDNSDFNKKLICIAWADPLLNNAKFGEKLTNANGIIWGSPTSYIKLKLEELNIKSEPVIAGVNGNNFYPLRKIQKINTIGMVCPSPNPINPEHIEAYHVKKPEILIEVANKCNLAYEFINNRPPSDNMNLYNNIDMYVCASASEAGPFSIAEAAFCKIPVISTPVGYASKFKSIKTFTTIDEAVSIINELNSDPKKLEKYINDVYEELTHELNWDKVAKKYWKPLIKKRIKI